MLQIILSAIAVYVSTSIDNLFILLILFSQAHSKKAVLQVFGGQYLGTGILVGISLLVAYLFNLIPQDWIIGLLGLVPLFLGIRLALAGEDNDEDMAQEINKGKSRQLIWTVTLISIASGGDNLGIYIPFFTALSVGQILVTIVIFILGTAILNYMSYRLARVNFVAETLEKYERIIVPIVFIALGIFIMAENNTIQIIFNWLF